MSRANPSHFFFITLHRMKILMVCLGNICRSPIAEGVMVAKMNKYGVPGSVSSAGILSYHSGSAPDHRAIRISGDKGLDISSQKAQQIKEVDFKNYDLIFAMDQPVLNSIKSLTPLEEHRKKVHLFLEYAGYPSGSEVPDPYYSEIESFQKVFDLVDDACDKIVKKWKAAPTA